MTSLSAFIIIFSVPVSPFIVITKLLLGVLVSAGNGVRGAATVFNGAGAGTGAGARAGTGA